MSSITETLKNKLINKSNDSSSTDNHTANNSDLNDTCIKKETSNGDNLNDNESHTIEDKPEHKAEKIDNQSAVSSRASSANLNSVSRSHSRSPSISSCSSNVNNEADRLSRSGSRCSSESAASNSDNENLISGASFKNSHNKNSKNVTVYDMLSQIVGFSTLSIKLCLK